ncbi:helix-turn-helix domain containing protein [Aliarcobacter cryaerophilus]|uniref:helix-turn-helix domain containing protein n=1 Tax=Aliarcobacter cryaerophilus TaxID=28198 RepID=UPI0021B556D9|nr:helix-turn-helix domain containing protein [Aliarcobacter cryaerophilus]MCT7509774.1 helix-turn-helix domain containing protein [Aliarcobacter cryaerophilus]
MENAEFFIEKLLKLYKVSNVAELSKEINTSQKTISNWKIRNSISAIKKKCRELGIYDEIFGDSEIKFDLELGRRFYSKEEIEQMERESNEGYIQYLELQNKRLNKIPYSLMSELELLFNIINKKDENTIKEITYEIEDYIVDLKKRLRE